MQTAGGHDDGFVLEFQEGSTERHLRVADSELLSSKQVVQAFIEYSEGSTGWRDLFQWEPMDL